MAYLPDDEEPSRPESGGRPPRRAYWLVGTAVLFVLGLFVGGKLGNVGVGLLVAAIVWLGWLMAAETAHAKTPHLHDEDDDGARL